MEGQETTPSPEYLKAFNSGYALSQHEPELLNSILQSNQQDTDFINGLKDGMKQAKLEEIQQQTARQRGQQQARKPKR